MIPAPAWYTHTHEHIHDEGMIDQHVHRHAHMHRREFKEGQHGAFPAYIQPLEYQYDHHWGDDHAEPI